jgi:hypothetical protein
MRSTWVAALLLASAIAVPAYAQDHDHEGRDGGGQHQGGGQVQHFQPQQQQGGQAAAAAGARAGQTAGGHFQGRPDGGGQAWQGRPSGRDDQGRPVLNGVPHGNYGQRGDGQPGGWNGGRPNNGGQGQGWNGARPNNTGQGWNGGRPDRGGDNGRNWNGGRPDRGGDHGRNWNGGRPDRGGDNGRNWNGGDRGDWNRGWRQDNRYNWQGWRSQHREIYRAGRYRPPYGGWGYRSFGIGSAIDSIFYAQNYWIDNPDYYRLPPAYGPYRWVRYYNDALLIDIEDGEVVDAIPNFFY